MTGRVIRDLARWGSAFAAATATFSGGAVVATTAAGRAAIFAATEFFGADHESSNIANVLSDLPGMREILRPLAQDPANPELITRLQSVAIATLGPILGRVATFALLIHHGVRPAMNAMMAREFNGIDRISVRDQIIQSILTNERDMGLR